jgi:ssDNA-binding Zn-finger/Zn-ribbon topoisomerase 1
MEEVYTCNCGNQAWTVMGTTIKCPKCGRHYHLKGKDPSGFNSNREGHVVLGTCQWD